MANAIIRAAPVFFKGKKIAEIETANLEINGGDEAQFGSEGYLAHSQGAITTKLDCNTIVPVAGLSVTIIDALLRKLDVVVGMAVGGKLLQANMRPINARYETDSRTGKLTGQFSFEGGKPEAVG